MSASIPPDAKRFKMAILPLTVFIFAGGFILGHSMGLCMHLMRHHFHVDWFFVLKVILYSIPVLLICAFVMAFIISLAFPSYIYPTGIYGHSFWGVRRYLGWTDIVQARKLRFGNLIYLRLFSKNGKGIVWFPLFQSPRVEFLNEIQKFAPPKHPILNYLN